MVKDKIKLNTNKMDVNTFGNALGQAVWLMSMADSHKDLPIKSIEAGALTAVLLQQFKLYSKDKKPVAFLTWANVSDEIKERFDKGDKTLELKDWRSGNNIVIVDCVSPYNPASIFEKTFLESVKATAS